MCIRDRLFLFDRPFDVVKHADRFMLFMFEFLVIKGEGAEIGALGALARRIGADFGLFRGHGFVRGEKNADVDAYRPHTVAQLLDLIGDPFEAFQELFRRRVFHEHIKSRRIAARGHLTGFGGLGVENVIDLAQEPVSVHPALVFVDESHIPEIHGGDGEAAARGFIKDFPRPDQEAGVADAVRHRIVEGNVLHHYAAAVLDLSLIHI